jgi:hypothetical protein
MGDIADEDFLGFAKMGAPGASSTYSQFTFAKTPLKHGDNPDDNQSAGGAGDADTDAENVGVLEVRFATAVSVPLSSEAMHCHSPDEPGSMRLMKEPSEVAAVHEIASAKDGRTIGVSGGKSTQADRIYTAAGICYGEDLPHLNVVIRLRERWWLEAKGIIPKEDGKMVGEDVGDTGFALRPNNAESSSGEPVSKKPKVQDKIDLDEDAACSSKFGDALSVDMAPKVASTIKPEVAGADGSTEETDKKCSS